jgi:hypothetical protein
MSSQQSESATHSRLSDTFGFLLEAKGGPHTLHYPALAFALYS